MRTGGGYRKASLHTEIPLAYVTQVGRAVHTCDANANSSVRNTMHISRLTVHDSLRLKVRRLLASLQVHVYLEWFPLHFMLSLQLR